MAAAERRGRLLALTLGAIASLLLVAYIVVWLGVDPAHQLRADFVAAYQGGSVLRTLGGAHIYDVASGLTTPQALGLPTAHNGVYFVTAPLSAVLVLPFTFLDLHTAWLAWSLLQLGAVVAAVAVTAAAAPWPSRDRVIRVATALLAAAGAATLVLLVQAQWSGLFALGIACGYALWRRGNQAAGAAVALGPILAVKPNLAIGVIVFLIGWGNRRVLLGMIACSAGVLLASFALAGVHGSAAFVSAMVHDSRDWPASSMNGIAGLVASLLGDGGIATALGVAASVATAALAFPLGRAVRRRAQVLEPALAGAVCLTVLASPHLLFHDLTPLEPCLVLAVVTAARVDQARGSSVPGPACVAVGALWLLISGAIVAELGAASVGFPGRVVAWLLLAAAALAFVAVRRCGGVLRPRLTSAPAAPGGSMESARTPAGTTPRAPDAARGW